MTSQWLADLVLGPLDRHVVERLRVGGYVRDEDELVRDEALDPGAGKDVHLPLPGCHGP